MNEGLADTTSISCVHYQKIQEAVGPISAGVCKHCYSVKEFTNYTSNPKVTGDRIDSDMSVARRKGTRRTLLVTPRATGL